MIIALDTNILVYAIDTAAGPRHRTASVLVERVLRAHRAVLLLQTIAEFYSVATRKLGIPSRDTLLFLDGLRTILAIQAADALDFDRATSDTARDLAFWDALLWATCDRIGVRYLLTEDFQDGRRLGNVTFLDPFKDRNCEMIDRLLSRAGGSA